MCSMNRCKLSRLPGEVTVPYRRGDIAPGTWNSILRQAGLIVISVGSDFEDARRQAGDI